ncbi:hypothetical protein bcgnr5372_27360 [Bacillus luti]|nr:hypothetical protein [Bacillus cereus]HDR8331176.1 hypothetical protein [Bacillus cereus]HDR8338027.1 hypothetical protein [Bacillus cereus]
MGFIGTLICLIIIFGLIDWVKKQFSPAYEEGSASTELSSLMGCSKETIVRKLQTEWESHFPKLQEKFHKESLAKQIPEEHLFSLYNQNIHRIYEKAMMDLFLDNFSFELGLLASGQTNEHDRTIENSNNKIISYLISKTSSSDARFLLDSAYKEELIAMYRRMTTYVCKLARARGKAGFYELKR